MNPSQLGEVLAFDVLVSMSRPCASVWVSEKLHSPRVRTAGRSVGASVRVVRRAWIDAVQSVKAAMERRKPKGRVAPRKSVKSDPYNSMRLRDRDVVPQGGTLCRSYLIVVI